MAKKLTISLLIALIMGLFLLSQPILLELTSSWRQPASIPDRQVELEIQKVVPVQPEKSGINSDSVAMVVPTNMPAGSRENELEARIVDHNIQNLIKGKYMKNSKIMESAKKVQETVQPSAKFVDSHGIEHKVNLDIEPVQSRAKVQYTGFVDTDMAYNTRSQSVEVSVAEKLSERTQMSVEHQSQQDLSLVKFQFNW